MVAGVSGLYMLVGSRGTCLGAVRGRGRGRRGIGQDFGTPEHATMKQVVRRVIDRKGKVVLLDLPEPHVSPGQVLIKTQYTLISSGTEARGSSSATGVKTASCCTSFHV